MKTMIMYTDCLTYEQLQNYTLSKGDTAERAQIYKHISTCELCACAVNGFAAIPFTSADVDAIHNQIDVKTNATHASPLTSARVFIITVSLLSIFGFYKFSNSFADNTVKMTSLDHSQSSAISVPIIGAPSFSENKTAAVNKTIKHVKSVVNEQPGKIIVPVEPMKSISARMIEPSLSARDITLQPVYNSDVIYIYDLKVADYTNLYFSHVSRQPDFGKSTPAFKENKGASNNLIENDEETAIAADRVLKKGLEYFNKGRCSDAILEFQLLLENNPDDANALFYCGAALYQEGKYNLAVKDLNAVLRNPNNVFHPEAKWNLVLVYLKLDDKIRAKQLLTEIINEKGFYAKRASDKLKTL